MKRYAKRDRDFPRKDENGNRVCRWCRKPIVKGVYCCPEHGVEVDVRCGFSVRYHVHERDKGVCADCGISTEDLDDALSELRWKIKEAGHHWQVFSSGEFVSLLREAGIAQHYLITTECIHHVIPVEEGGGCCGLENLITLCIRCHKRRHATKRR
jgi:hypothetical protein